LEMIRKLHDAMGIPTEVLVREYWFTDLQIHRANVNSPLSIHWAKSIRHYAHNL
jgi:hypothetical protein